MGKSHKAQLRQEKASTRAVKAQQAVGKIAYRVESDDVLILNGPYRDRRVRELFAVGAVERDYVVRHIWFNGGPEVARIIASMTCK